MATVILSIAATGFLLLFAATVWLVVLNWNDKIYGPLLSILVVGVAVAFAAVLITLKESKIESSFATPVVIDEEEGLPPLVTSDQAKFKIVERLNGLHWLANSFAFPNKAGAIEVPKGDGPRTVVQLLW